MGKNFNSDFPISLKYIQPIIQRVYERYPIVEKKEIILITKVFFESLRELLISGNTISLNNLFPRMYLISFNKFRKNKFSRIVKIKLSTPERIKNG